MDIHPGNTVIGFIGTGVMGRSMAVHLYNAGYKLVIFNRSKEKAQPLLELGAEWQDTVADVARKADLIITMVGYPHDVEQVYFGADGIIENVHSGAYLLDMTTSSPRLAQKIDQEASARDVHALDAPVSGGDIGARNASLAIMVGGNPDDFAAVKPVLQVMGNNIILQGGAGAGQYTKMCNQIAIASNMMGVSEALAYAVKAGLDPNRVLDSISTGAAGSWSLSNLAPRMIAGNFAPGFYVKHFIKDMKIALDSAKELGIRLPGLELANSLYKQLAEHGQEDCGTQVLIQWYQ